MSDPLRRLSVLYELTSALSGRPDVDAELEHFIDVLTRALVLDTVVIYDGAGADAAADLPPRASLGLRRERAVEARLPAAAVPALLALGPGLHRLAPDAAHNAAPGYGDPAHAVRAVPLCVGGELRGVLVVARAGGRFDAFLTDMVTRIAPRLALVLDHERTRAMNREAEARIVAELQANAASAQRALEADTARAAIVGAALEAIVLIDVDGRIIEFNPAAERLFGWPRAAVIGRDIADVIMPPDLREHHRAGLERFRRTGESRMHGRRVELPAIRADGSRLTAEIAIVRLADRTPTEFAGFIRDISERKVMEAAVQAERARFLALFEHSPDAIVLVAADGRITLGNQASRDVLGHGPDALHGMAFENLFPPESRPQHTELLARCLAGESPSRRTTGNDPAQVLRADGGLVFADISMNPLTLEGAPAVIVSIRDVSERIRAQEERRRLDERLRHAHRMESLGTLAGGVAHYFNNLLTAIIGNLDLLGDAESLDGDARRDMRELRTASLRAADLVSQILAFSRRTPMNRQALAVGPVVCEVTRLLRNVIPSGIELRLAVGDGLPDVMADAQRLHQALVNLVVNASQAIAEGEGKIDVSADAVDLAGDAALPRGRYVRVRVSDTGPGMDDATQMRIFDPFFTTKPIGQGTGLGLAEVHGIAAEHHGAVMVDSVPGEGSTFTLLLPAAPDAAA